MKIDLIEKLGDGAFADVWRGSDELDREVAVKIVRPANASVADALAHAKALARANHPNVVSVLTIERIADPETGEMTDCVVMELIHGETLESTLKGPKLTREQAQKIGQDIIQGLAHIHHQGMAHGDLHEENVMVAGNKAKVIDILYLNSLASLTTENRERRLRRDLLSLRILLQQLIIQSELDSAEATEFNNLLESDSTIEDIQHAFSQIFSSSVSGSDERAIDHAYARLTEEEFVEGEEYAQALSDETPDDVVFPILKRLVVENDYDRRQRDYVTLLWERLDSEARDELMQELGKMLDSNVPKGKWVPSIRLLRQLGKDGWDRLSLRIRIKVEGAVVKDVIAGNKDIHSSKAVSGGVLGTYASTLWRRFSKPDVLADNLISLLNQNWFTQNYVGEYFLDKIPAIAKVTGKRAEFIKAIKTAVANDARLIVRNINDALPDDWIEEIRGD